MSKKDSSEPIPRAVAPDFKKPGKAKRGGDPGFGKEGTNKTQPVPEPHAEPSAELQGTKSKYIPKTPFTRG